MTINEPESDICEEPLTLDLGSETELLVKYATCIDRIIDKSKELKKQDQANYIASAE